MSEAVRLAVRGVSKRFGATQALYNVDLEIRQGQVHALLGHNGSGKSTLIKIIGGYHTADHGRIDVNGTPLPRSYSPNVVYGVGVRFVHQDLGLVNGLTVSENLALRGNFKRSRLGGISWRRQREFTVATLESVGLRIRPDLPVSALGPVERTLLAIARATQDLDIGSGVLVLDEPTARLPRSEAIRLLETVRSLKSKGAAVLYVTHRLGEVFEAADEVTVLRDGRGIFSSKVAETSDAEVRAVIAGMRVGKGPIADGERSCPRHASGEALVEVRDLSGTRVKGVTLALHAGELLAITGTIGSGRSELGRLMYGLQSPSAGRVSLGGQWMDRVSRAAARAGGVGYVPQERSDGLALLDTIAENIGITSYEAMRRWYGVPTKELKKVAQQVIRIFTIRPGNEDMRVAALSGGNQQKVAIGKWTRLDCRTLILDEPLQGIDVGAKAEIMQAIRERVLDRGGGVLWIESDAELVPRYADRAIVMSDGQIVAEFSGASLTSEGLLRAIYGERPTAQ